MGGFEHELALWSPYVATSHLSVQFAEAGVQGHSVSSEVTWEELLESSGLQRVVAVSPQSHQSVTDYPLEVSSLGWGLQRARKGVEVGAGKEGKRSGHQSWEGGCR